MNLLFVHSAEKIKQDTLGNYHTDGSYNQEVWDRYLSLFGSMSVIFRKDTTIYDPEEAQHSLQFFDKDKVNLICIPDLKSSFTQFLSYQKRKEIDDTIRQAVLKHDHIIARLSDEAGFTAVKYAKQYGKPYLIEAVACPFGSLWNHSWKGKVLAVPYMLQMKKALRDAEHVVYVTEKFLQQRYPTKGRSIGCSDVSLPYVDETLLEKRLEKISGSLPGRPLAIGTLGALNMRNKGQHDVIEALAVLKKQGHDFEYQLAGGGESSFLMAVAEKLDVRDRVKFLGPLSHDKVFDFLDSIDIYIQPSKQEGLPRALIEAMSRGCLALGSEVGGIPELLGSEYCFSAGNVKEICAHLIAVDQTMMTKAAKRNLNKAKDFEKEKLNRKRTAFYKGFIASGPH